MHKFKLHHTGLVGDTDRLCPTRLTATNHAQNPTLGRQARPPAYASPTHCLRRAPIASQGNCSNTPLSLVYARHTHYDPVQCTALGT